MDFTQARRFLAAMPGAEEDYPFGPDALSSPVALLNALRGAEVVA